MENLTHKEQGFVKDYVETHNATEAASRNYDVKSRDVARSIGAENLTKPHIQKVVRNLIDEIPDDLIKKVHLEGLNATYKSGRDTLPDYATRHKYLDTTYKLRGDYAAEKHINLNVNVSDNPKAQELAQQYEEELKKNL